MRRGKDCPLHDPHTRHLWALHTGRPTHLPSVGHHHRHQRRKVSASAPDIQRPGPWSEVLGQQPQAVGVHVRRTDGRGVPEGRGVYVERGLTPNPYAANGQGKHCRGAGQGSMTPTLAPACARVGGRATMPMPGPASARTEKKKLF